MFERELKKIKNKIRKKGLHQVDVFVLDNQAVRLSGKVDNWNEKITAGYIAAKSRFKGVVNDIKVKGIVEPEPKMPLFNDSALEGRSFDVVIIGGGVTGSAIARELSRYKLSIALLEKESDLAMQASGRNDGMIHPGLAPAKGTKKAYYNTKGNRMYTQAAKELGFELQRPGSLVLFAKWWYRLLVPVLKLKCRQNGVDGNYRYLSKKEVLKKEPHADKNNYGGFLLPSAGIVSPYRVTYAFAENAITNGAEVFLNCAVISLKKEDNQLTEVLTNRGSLKASVVVNAAGVWADKIAAMAEDQFFTIHGRKGTDAILDKKYASLQKLILGKPVLLGGASGHSKGGGVVLCVEGNLLLGPDAVEVFDREDCSTDRENFSFLLSKLSVNPSLKSNMIITYYSGVRAATYKEDFIIEQSKTVNNLFYAAGIQSPGLASAPAIASDISDMVVDFLRKTQKVEPRPDFTPYRKPITDMKSLSLSDRAAKIKEDPRYGHIICRCEEISEGEIREALNRPLKPCTLDGIKRRVRAGAGRCHGGFCTPRVLEIIADELGISVEEITKKGGLSNILTGNTRKEARCE